MSPDTPQACEIIVTGPTDDTLDKIARELVDARLIACANVLDAPVTSTYRRQGAVEVEPEKGMHMHTRLGVSAARGEPPTRRDTAGPGTGVEVGDLGVGDSRQGSESAASGHHEHPRGNAFG
jgi:hypothetical protein